MITQADIDILRALQREYEGCAARVGEEPSDGSAEIKAKAAKVAWLSKLRHFADDLPDDFPGLDEAKGV